MTYERLDGDGDGWGETHEACTMWWAPYASGRAGSS